ncbi:unnamed protein product [Microthlaspi erraticum]|uniref:Uncharacterized protein n=1 Tax=Microthlaspi erraticum TaxID=1685480 RepID=A0A6D2ID64_9BRAS|nr:unnamed protein product [Microthlaspi erraticum]
MLHLRRERQRFGNLQAIPTPSPHSSPAMDTSDLVRKNALTLIGRLTDPSEQRMRTMLPYFSNKWELRGNITGADLGNASFPSQIPFWISLRGLPLHYWKRELLEDIGDKLGDLKSYELTSTAAKIRVEIDGLKPITKEVVVEFEGGQEAVVTLEYHKYCSFCLRLTHEEEDCPENPRSRLNLPPTKTLSHGTANHLKPPFFTNPRDSAPNQYQDRPRAVRLERSATRHIPSNHSPPRSTNNNREQTRLPSNQSYHRTTISPPYQRDR